MLYFRMFLMMLISFYTSRVVLRTLGVDDFGINNAVGGLVSMFSILSASLSGAISRFLTFELGKEDSSRLRSIFSTSVNIQIAMAVVVIVAAEIAGGWFLHARMNIPGGRMDAAEWVLHCSILTFAVNLVSIPYNACIIAHERMSAYAWISIAEALLKLAIVGLLLVSSYDKLKSYAVLLLCVAVIVRIMYGLYCRRHFAECRYEMRLDRGLLKEMSGFAGWNFFGNSAYILNTQGVNMLINVYFGVAVNAARGVAVQIEGAVNQFVTGFMTALNPQITKTYASGDSEAVARLVCRGSKFSFFIMLMLVVPLEFEAETVLRIWLGNVPEGAAIFLRLVLVASLANVIGNPLYTAVLATGRIRRYQLMVTSYAVLVFSLTWIAYSAGFPAYVTYVIYAVIYFTMNAIRLYELGRLTGFPVRDFVSGVLLRISAVSAVAVLLPMCLYLTMEPGWVRLVLICVLGVLWTGFSCFVIGLDRPERDFIIKKAAAALHKNG